MSIAYATQIIDPGRLPGHRHAPFLGSDTLDDNKVLEAAKGTDIQLYVSTFYQEGGDPEFDAGIKEYINTNADAMAANGGDDTIAAVTAMGYDAYYVALEAIKAAGSADPAAIKAALWDVTYTGVSGHIAFDDVNGDAIRDTAYIKHCRHHRRRLGAGDRPDRPSKSHLSGQASALAGEHPAMRKYALRAPPRKRLIPGSFRERPVPP